MDAGKGHGSAGPAKGPAAAETAADRSREALAAIESRIRKTEGFSTAAGRSLRRDPTGKGLGTEVGRAAALRRLRRLALVVLVLAAFLVLVPPFTWPIRGRVSSDFFFRRSPIRRSSSTSNSTRA